MPIPQDLYYLLNKTFDAVREAEREAARLDAEAERVRDGASKKIQALYDAIGVAIGGRVNGD